MTLDTPSIVSHTDAAQGVVEKLRAIRDSIPNLVVPTSGRESQRLASAAAVPPEFVELTLMSVKNNPALTRGTSLPESTLRDLTAFADAYGPVADELQAMLYFVRHSVTAAKNTVGNEALTTYALAQRLAKRPETAALRPVVAAMQRTLARRFPRPQPAPQPPVNESPK